MAGSYGKYAKLLKSVKKKVNSPSGVGQSDGHVIAVAENLDRFLKSVTAGDPLQKDVVPFKRPAKPELSPKDTAKPSIDPNKPSDVMPGGMSFEERQRKMQADRVTSNLSVLRSYRLKDKHPTPKAEPDKKQNPPGSWNRPQGTVPKEERPTAPLRERTNPGEDFDDRLARIRTSFGKINQLMTELKRQKSGQETPGKEKHFADQKAAEWGQRQEQAGLLTPADKKILGSAGLLPQQKKKGGRKKDTVKSVEARIKKQQAVINTISADPNADTSIYQKRLRGLQRRREKLLIDSLKAAGQRKKDLLGGDDVK
jgi:hypothetical protein